MAEPDPAARPPVETRPLVETHDADGRLLATCTLDAEGRLDGRYTQFDAAGEPELAMEYAAGLPHGPAVAYAAGRPLAEMSYADGRLHGPMKLYDGTGRLSTLIPYVDGLREGTLVAYGPDGKPLLTESYAAGRRSGPTVEYDDAGTVRRRATYADDLLDGEEILFHPGGQPRQRTLWRAGVAVEGPRSFPDPAAPKPSLLARLLGAGKT